MVCAKRASGSRSARRCKQMTFVVEGVLRQDDPDSEVRRVGEYETREEAIAAAKVMVNDFLRRE